MDTLPKNGHPDTQVYEYSRGSGPGQEAQTCFQRPLQSDPAGLSRDELTPRPTCRVKRGSGWAPVKGPKTTSPTSGPVVTAAPTTEGQALLDTPLPHAHQAIHPNTLFQKKRDHLLLIFLTRNSFTTHKEKHNLSADLQGAHDHWWPETAAKATVPLTQHGPGLSGAPGPGAKDGECGDRPCCPVTHTGADTKVWDGHRVQEPGKGRE